MDVGHSYRLLLVDDELEFLEIVQRRFVRRGYQVVLCQTERDALDAAATGGVDAVVTDRSLKSGDGLSLVRALRRAQTTLPILVMSGFGGDDARQEAIAAGAVAYLVKPFPLSELEAAIESALLGRAIADNAAPVGA